MYFRLIGLDHNEGTTLVDSIVCCLNVFGQIHQQKISFYAIFLPMLIFGTIKIKCKTALLFDASTFFKQGKAMVLARIMKQVNWALLHRSTDF